MLLCTCLIISNMSELNLFNVNIDKLFEEHTVTEILEIHKKIQHELDKKKQELRYMVGERYRDVITAADAIKSMQTSAENLYQHIDDINVKCHTLYDSINITESKPIVVDKVKNFYRSVAIQIKILISIPEYIWMCLDNGDFLRAVHLYLLAIHIYTGLELDTEHKIAEIFTILSRLKLSINSFRNRILDGIRKRLQAVHLGAEETSNHLCAYMLLENKSQEIVIKEFIQLRQQSLNDLLNSDISVHNVVRVQIINLMNCIICTILLIHSCFIGYDNQSDGLVQIKMKEILSPDAEKVIKLVELESTPLLHYLPVLVRDFRPSCSQGQTSLTKQSVQEIVASWLQTTATVLNLNLSKSFELITSVKTLQTIREEAFKVETRDNWLKICSETYLPKKFTVWQYFFQHLVSKRAEVLICHKIELNLSYLYDKLEDVFSSGNSEKSEKDLRWYVWNEDLDDLSKDKIEHPGLAMKTKGHSKKIVHLCKNIDDKYLELIQDVDVYLHERDKTEKIKNPEISHLETHFRKQTYASVEKLLVHIEALTNSSPDKNAQVIKAVIAARVLQAIPQLCPNLVKSCSYGDCAQDWDSVQTILTQKNIQFWQRWLNATKQNIQDILCNFLVDVKYQNMLQILPRWNTIEIEEQTEDKTFTSQIRIPSQPSVTLLTTLSEISAELNTILPHTLPKIIHEQFIETIAALILERYVSLSSAELNQIMSLQFLLDVKYLTTICVKRDNKELMNKSQLICDELRSKIDPFDLDVFYPYLQVNVKRSVIQTQTYFGCFLPAQAQLASLGTIEAKSVDNEPCIISISTPTTDVWFPLLPITAPVMKTLSVEQKTPQHRVITPKKEIPPTKEEPDSSSGSTFVRSGAAALFGAMTNDWFS